MNLIQTLIRKSHSEGTEGNGIAKLCEDPCAEQLLRAGGYCKLLWDRAAHGWEDDAVAAANDLLQREMSFVPAGSSKLQSIGVGDTASDPIEVADQGFFMDRFAVTNAQFERFVNGNGYRQQELWPESIVPLLFQFVDQSGKPGPRFWQQGGPPHDRREHPVVGICWYEAHAYATWVGKRLPTTSQWQRAGTWWQPNVRHPWGNSFEQCRTHTGLQSSTGSTIPVQQIPEGATPNAIHQLVGNVWEWTETAFDHVEIDQKPVALEEPYGEIRGGAFDTYLLSQTNCLFRSGQPLLSRLANVGFRCCVAADCLAAEQDE